MSKFLLKRSRQAPAEETPAFGGVAERFRRAGDLDRAISLCREGLKKFPMLLSARVTLGWALLDQAKFDEARVELEQVLRRAPDNLAAIRGLAELHDRAEHTMSLPMDGPGQWPPSEDAVNEAASAEFEPEIVHTPAPGAFEAMAAFAGDGVADEPDLTAEPMAVFTADAIEEPEIVARAVDVEPFEVGGDVEPEVEPEVESVAAVSAE